MKMRGRISRIEANRMSTNGETSAVQWFFLFSSLISMVIAVNSSLKVDQILGRVRP